MKTTFYLFLLSLCLYSCQSTQTNNNQIAQEYPKPIEPITADTTTSLVPLPETIDSSKNDLEEATRVDREIEAIIPFEFTIVQNEEGLEIVKADFNKDSLIDVAVLIEYRGDTTFEFSEEVFLIIGLRTKEGTLEKRATTGNLGGESISYEGQKHLWEKNGVLSYLHQSMRHHVALKYRHDYVSDHFLLIGAEYETYGSQSDPPQQISFNFLTGKKIIRDQTWDEQSEELVELPEQMEVIDTLLMPLHMLDWDNVYWML